MTETLQISVDYDDDWRSDLKSADVRYVYNNDFLKGYEDYDSLISRQDCDAYMSIREYFPSFQPKRVKLYRLHCLMRDYIKKCAE